MIGFPIEINEEWSIYCLNSALTSFAGHDWKEYQQLKDDERRLNVDTRNLNDWVQKENSNDAPSSIISIRMGG